MLIPLYRHTHKTRLAACLLAVTTANFSKLKVRRINAKGYDGAYTMTACTASIDALQLDLGNNSGGNINITDGDESKLYNPIEPDSHATREFFRVRSTCDVTKTPDGL